MGVGIVEAGHDEAAVKIEGLRARINELIDVALRADGEDALPLNCHRLITRHTPAIVTEWWLKEIKSCSDVTVHVDGIGLWLGISCSDGGGDDNNTKCKE